MHRAIVLLVLLNLATASAQAQKRQPGSEWLAHLAPLRSGDAQPFQFQEEIVAGPERLVAYVSWAPPDSRCVILCDRFDGLPLLVAVDGKAWLYDPIGGQIVLVRAEPQLLTRMVEEGIRSKWGICSDSRDPDSQITINVDLAGVMRHLAGGTEVRCAFDAASRTMRCSGEQRRAVLTGSAADAARPASFLFVDTSNGPNRFVGMRFGSFVFGGPVPSWHHAVNRDSLAARLPVVASADAARLPEDVRKRLDTMHAVFVNNGLFILRPALRDSVLRHTIEEHTPIHLDFNAIAANDTRMRDAWRAALHSQGFDLPALTEPELLPPQPWRQ
ncbi:MAG TPA: hypothetical protein VHI13_18780 [Candidatus Kapabacteria bacterium]|nr:hypothetical protein [Candidatus Kapabacteria bacterium]